MTDTEFDNLRLDEMLKMFDGCKNGGVIKREVLFTAKAPEDWRLAVELLTKEGYLKEYEDRFEITYKGKSFIHNGGFSRKNTTESVLFYCTIIAAVSSVLALVVSVVALCCQLCC